MAFEITDSNFNETISAGKPVVVDFWAPWCGPCKMVSPIIDELSETYAEKVIIGKVNVDENDDTCVDFGIRNIPTILFFKDGALVDKHVGAISKAQLAEKIETLL